MHIDVDFLGKLKCKNLRNFFKGDEEISKLYCYYKQDHPYLLLAPFKVEIVRFDPLAVIFHDVISNEEISIIQEVSHSRVNFEIFPTETRI